MESRDGDHRGEERGIGARMGTDIADEGSGTLGSGTDPGDSDEGPHTGARARSEDRATAGDKTVELSLLNAGFCRHIGKLFMPGGPMKAISIPALFALIRHPSRGVGLFDTGYSRRFYEGTKKLPYRLYRLATPTYVKSDDEAVARVKAQGVEPEEVEWIVLSHLDPDHYGGLPDFPEARVYLSKTSWETLENLEGKPSVEHRVLPGALPDDLEERVWPVDLTEGESGDGPRPQKGESGDGPPFYGGSCYGFSPCVDLFGDETVRLVSLPGHVPGQLGAFVRTRRHGTVFLVADACWSLMDLRAKKAGIHRRLAKDKRAQRETYEKIRELMEIHPEVTVVPSHCPETADSLSVNTNWRQHS